MLSLLLILIALCARECTPQKCYYGPANSNQVICFNMTSVVEIKDNVENQDLIEIFELSHSVLPNLSITALKFLPSLKEIKISSSHISRLSSEEENTDGLNGFPVCKITLEGNHMQVIEPNSFYGLSNLRELSLKGNEIKEIDASTTFQYLSQLDLSHNSISKIGK
ncbi:hypothetical protein ILUMI_07649, partial [Ignelater luminosus]